jgi:acyl-homoserine-lactone acylase
MSRPMFAPLGAMAAALLTACGGSYDAPTPPPTPQPEFQADVRTTRYGVPHVQAADFASLGFGAAQVYLRDNFCVLADQILTVNGDRSKHLGITGPAGNATVSFVPVPNRDSDFFHKSYFDDQALKAAYQQASIESRELVRGYIAGYNEFVQAAPAAGAPARNACDGAPWVRPIEERDFLRLLAAKSVLASGAAFARAIATAQPPTAAASPAGSVRGKLASLDRDVVMAQLNPYPTRGAASNAYAIGKDATSNGAGMLLGNPHYPWPASTNRFYEVHLTVPGKLDVFGGMNGDTPVPLIGFNKDVAWTHTVSPTLRQTLFEISLVPGSPTRYRVGNEERDMVAREFGIEVLQADGSLVTERRTLYSTHLGAVLQINSLVAGGVNLQWSATTAYALRDANLNAVRQVEQWLRIGQAGSVRAIEQALGSVAAIPFIHTIAADRHGEALMADIGPVPNVPAAKLQPAAADGSGGCVKGKTAQAILQLVNLPILDGARPECDWAVEAGAPAPGLMPIGKLPAIVRSDYVANSNQSAWFAHPQARVDGLEPILGGGGTPLSLRQRLAFMQIEQRMAATDGLSPTPGFDSLETMRKLLFGNRLMAAELALPTRGSTPTTVDGLLQVCLVPTPGDGELLITIVSGPFAGQAIDIAPACAVLQAWDGRANLDSRGTVLFREFWRRLKMPSGTPLWTTGFDPLDPVHTPRGLNTTAGPARDTLRQALAETVADLAAKELDIAKPLADLQSVTRAGKRIAMPGDDEPVGPFNKVTPLQPALAPLTKAGYTDVFNGSSYIQAVTWVGGVVEARGLLAYSQSSDPASPHHADQTELLYAASKFARLPFSDAEITADQIGSAEKIVSKRLR